MTIKALAYEDQKVSDEQKKKIENNFTYHPPTGNQPEKYEALRGLVKLAAYKFCKVCPPSRELSLALTKLEEAAFWANAAIARNENASTSASTPPLSAKE